MASEEWHIVRFTVLMAVLAVMLIVPPGLFLGWLLARKQWFGKSIFETMLSLPLVMPPVATGLILLKLFGRRGPLGHFFEAALGIEIVFTWRAVLLALAVMSFPLFVRAARVAFEEVSVRFEQVARTLGASPVKVFFTITVPMARRGLIAGMVLAFARALGEFGATILVAGAIPERTSTIAVSIFSFIQLGQDSSALKLLLISFGLSFSALWVSEHLQRKGHR